MADNDSSTIGDSGRDVKKRSVFLRDGDGGVSDSDRVQVTMTAEEREKMAAEAEHEGKSFSEKWRESVEAGRNDLNPAPFGETERGTSVAVRAMKQDILALLDDADGKVQEDALYEIIADKYLAPGDEDEDDGDEESVFDHALKALLGEKVEYTPREGYELRGGL